MIYNQIVTWTAFAILAMFLYKAHFVLPNPRGAKIVFFFSRIGGKIWIKYLTVSLISLEYLDLYHLEL